MRSWAQTGGGWGGGLWLATSALGTMRLRVPGITQFYPSHTAQSRPIAGAGHCLPVAGRSRTLHSLHGGARSIGSESGAAAVTSQMWYLHPRALTLTPFSFPRTKGALGSHVTPWGLGPGLDPVSVILSEDMGVPHATGDTPWGPALLPSPPAPSAQATNYLTVLEVRNPKSVLLGYNRGVGKTAFFPEA